MVKLWGDKAERVMRVGEKLRLVSVITDTNVNSSGNYTNRQSYVRTTDETVVEVRKLQVKLLYNNVNLQHGPSFIDRA